MQDDDGQWQGQDESTIEPEDAGEKAKQANKGDSQGASAAGLKAERQEQWVGAKAALLGTVAVLLLVMMSYNLVLQT